MLQLLLAVRLALMPALMLAWMLLWADAADTAIRLLLGMQVSGGYTHLLMQSNPAAAYGVAACKSEEEFMACKC